MNRTSRLAILLIGLVALETAVQAQETGRIVGTIIDAESGDALVGAYVVLEGTELGAASDLEGDFRIRGLEPGAYTLESSMIGYSKTTVVDVEVVAGEATRLDLTLVPEAIAVEEVVVQARAVRNTEAALLKERQKAAAVSDAISAEDISRAGSGDAAEAMSHVTGATVMEGKFVVIRGLGDRYSTVQLNGAQLPSADPERRTVPMDLFPSSMLENIVTVKSFTPDNPGNFTGGAVDIGTRTMPDDFYLSVSASTSYNTNTSFGNVLTYDGGGTDWLGWDDGTRELPESVADPDAVPGLIDASLNEEAAQKAESIARSFSPVMAPTAGNARLNHGNSIAIGNQLSLGGRPLGLVASLSYSRKESHYDDGRYARYRLPGQTSTTLDRLISLEDKKSSEEAQWGALFSSVYRPRERHELGVTAIYTRTGEDVTRYLTGLYPEQLDANKDTYETRALHFTERRVRSYQLNGKHHLGERGVRAEWGLSTSESVQDEPDLRFFSNHYSVDDDGSYVYNVKGGNAYKDPSRYFRHLDESNREARLDVSVPVHQWLGLKGEVKVGGLVQQKERSFTERLFRYKRGSSVRYSGDPQEFFSDGYVGIMDSTGTRFRIGQVLEDVPTQSNNYDGEQEIYAGYGMVQMPLLPQLRAIAGVRMEATRTKVVSADSSVAPGALSENDWLPSVNLVYQIGEANVRGSYGRTLARPTMRELAPFSTFSFEGDFILTGNTELERTLTDNFDLRWEWFPNPGDILALTGFYKDFHDPIERAFITTNEEVQYVNVDEARVLGLEFEVRKNLGFLGGLFAGQEDVSLHDGLLSRFFVGGNLSLVDSRVDVPQSELQLMRAYDPDAGSRRPLQGQSPWVVNLDLTYDYFQTGTSAGVYFNRFGRRQTQVSLGGTPDIYEQGRSTLDFTMSQKLGPVFTLKLSAKNLTNSTVRYVYPDPSGDLTAASYTKGRTFSVGLGYKLGK